MRGIGGLMSHVRVRFAPSPTGFFHIGSARTVRDRAFDRAIMLAAQHRSPLHVLHVVDEGVLPKGRTQRNVEDALVRLRHEVEESQIDPAVDTSVKVISGNVEKTILEEAVANQSSLIVMGLARDATLATVFRGTTADRVVRRAECPVLVVKAAG